MSYERKPYPTQRNNVESRAGGPVCAERLAERDHCHAQPLTIAMELLGDPKPGRSMLDLKRAQA
jgi:hypothetical protein